MESSFTGLGCNPDKGDFFFFFLLANQGFTKQGTSHFHYDSLIFKGISILYRLNDNDSPCYIWKNWPKVSENPTLFFQLSDFGVPTENDIEKVVVFIKQADSFK